MTPIKAGKGGSDIFDVNAFLIYNANDNHSYNYSWAMVNGGSHKVSDLVSLWSVPVGDRAKIEKIFGGREFARRLQGLGLREGMTVEVLQHRGRGVVVAHGGTRIALGQGVADKLLVVTE